MRVPEAQEGEIKRINEKKIQNFLIFQKKIQNFWIFPKNDFVLNGGSNDEIYIVGHEESDGEGPKVQGGPKT